MQIILQHVDGVEDQLTVPDEQMTGVGVIERGGKTFIFSGYIAQFSHKIMFTECKALRILQELTPKPGPRKFMGQKPKDDTNGCD